MSGSVPPARQCTSWGSYNTPALWQMVVNEDNNEGWHQVAAWGRLEQAVSAQRKRLVACKQALVEKWPTETSEASRVFVAHLDGLIASMDQTLKAASSTSSALAGILQSLATAKREMDPIRKEYESKSGDLILRSWDNAEDELDVRAREVMGRAEQAIMQYTPAIVSPPPYRLGQGTDGLEPFGPPRGPGSPGGASGLPGGGADALVPPVPHDPPSPTTGVTPPEPPGSGAGGGGGVSSGPILGGINPPGGGPGLPGVPGGPGIPGGPAGGPVGPGVPGVPGPGGPGGLPAGFGPGLIPPGGLGPAGNGRGTRGGGRPTGTQPGIGMPGAPGGRPGTAGGSGGRPGARGGAMSPGGVIGGAPLTGQPGQAGRRPGGTGADGRGRGGAGTAPGMMPGAGAPGRGNRSGGAEGDEWSGDPDNPWEVAEGVPPVIGPASATYRHDPGPGVIGLDQ